MPDKTIEEKLDELISMVSVLETKIGFVESDIQDLKTQEIEQIKSCVEQMASGHLREIERKEASKWKVEKL
jgi:hypothetical protein